MTGPRASHSPVYLVRGDGKTTGYGLTKLVMSQTGAVNSTLDMTTLSSTIKLFHGNQTVRRWVRNGGLWNTRVTEIAPAVTRSKLDRKRTRDADTLQPMSTQQHCHLFNNTPIQCQQMPL